MINLIILMKMALTSTTIVDIGNWTSEKTMDQKIILMVDAFMLMIHNNILRIY